MFASTFLFALLRNNWKHCVVGLEKSHQGARRELLARLCHPFIYILIQFVVKWSFSSASLVDLGQSVEPLSTRAGSSSLECGGTAKRETKSFKGFILVLRSVTAIESSKRNQK